MDDAWTWVARYEDGSFTAELDPHGDHGFADVDLERVRAFELMPADPDSRLGHFCVLVDPAKGQRPIFFRRRASGWMIAGGETSHQMTCIGRSDEHSDFYVFFDDAGHFVITDDRNAVD